MYAPRVQVPYSRTYTCRRRIITPLSAPRHRRAAPSAGRPKTTTRPTVRFSRRVHCARTAFLTHITNCRAPVRCPCRPRTVRALCTSLLSSAAGPYLCVVVPAVIISSTCWIHLELISSLVQAIIITYCCTYRAHII